MGIVVMPPARLPSNLEVLTQRYVRDELLWWEFEDAVWGHLRDGTLDEAAPLTPPFGLPPATRIYGPGHDWVDVTSFGSPQREVVEALPSPFEGMHIDRELR